MSNRFIGRGNLGAAPELKYVTVDGEQRAVVALRVYFDRLVPNGDEGFTDKGGFWLNVNLWGARAETVAKLLPKGARVRVEGTLVQDTWDDKATGEPLSRIEIQADSVDLDLGRVEAITFRPKTDAENGDVAEMAKPQTPRPAAC